MLSLLTTRKIWLYNYLKIYIGGYMFEYNYNSKDKALFVTLPISISFGYQFLDSISDMIDKTLYNKKNNVESVFFSCSQDAMYDKMSKAYLLNVWLYMSTYKIVKIHKFLGKMIYSTISIEDGARFKEINIIDDITDENLTYYRFHGDKNVKKPVDEMAKLLVEKNLCINSETVKEFLSTTIGEIFSNSINHSEQDEIFFMYDIIYEKGDFYLCINIIDYGTTIIANVYNFFDKEEYLDGKKCIEWAIQNGNTTRIGSGGYGLPTLISYIKSTGGNLYILSGNANYRLESGNETILDSKGVFSGTSITFKVKLYDTQRQITYDSEKESLVSINLEDI